MPRRAMPGFGLTLGVTLTYFGLIVALPLAALVVTAAGVPGAKALALLTAPRTLAAFRVSFGLSALAALVNVHSACCWPGC